MHQLTLLELLTIPVAKIISTFTEPIFARFLGFSRTVAENDQSGINFSML